MTKWYCILAYHKGVGFEHYCYYTAEYAVKGIKMLLTDDSFYRAVKVWSESRPTLDEVMQAMRDEDKAYE